MKINKIIILLAAMLLLSIGAFAQIGATLKGDVNGDGKIDVEDVTSVVDLILSGKTYGYFYFGTTQPTVENYQTLSGVVASYTSIDDAIGTTASIAEGQTLYLLCPAAWVKGKRVVLENGIGTTYNFIEDADAETVSGYVIYSTQAWNEATDLTLNFEITGGDEYYWYVGKDETLLGKNGTSYDLQLSNLPTVSSIDDIYSDSQNVGAEENNIYVVCPTEWVGQFKLMTLLGAEIPQTDKTSQITSGITGYSILRGNGKVSAAEIKVVRN